MRSGQRKYPDEGLRRVGERVICAELKMSTFTWPHIERPETLRPVLCHVDTNKLSTKGAYHSRASTHRLGMDRTASVVMPKKRRDTVVRSQSRIMPTPQTLWVKMPT